MERETGGADQLTLHVTGMTCGGCENAVVRVVSSLDGVSRVSASHRDNRVTVAYDPSRTDRAAIARTIETAGYHVSA
jgi:copper chaperone